MMYRFIRPARKINRILCSFLLLTGLFLGSCKTEIGEGDKTWNDMVEPFRKTADIDGNSLHYIDMGTGKPVVMIHGFADSTYCWHENVLPLKIAGYRLIVIDQPGLGRSDIPPEPYEFTIENQARAIVRLTEKLGVLKFSVVGHSMGGGIALYIMTNHPRRVQKAVLIAPVWSKPPEVQLMTLPGMEFLSTHLGGRWSIRMGLEDAYYDSDKVDAAMVDEYSRPVGKQGYWKMLISLEKQFFSAGFKKMDQSCEWVQAPTLIIWGRKDTWVPAEQGRMLNEKMPGSILQVIEDCGHNPHQECSTKVNPLLVGFLGAEE